MKLFITIKEENMTDAKSKSASAADKKLPTVKDLLEAGVHFGHETKRWNPSFRDYIFTKRGKFHIIDLKQTLEKLEEAMNFLEKVSSDGEIMIVGTKRQARDTVKEEAVRCGAHFVTNRWVGGQVTNFQRISKSIKKLRDIENQLSGDISEYSQQQLSVLRREWGRLNRLFGGVKTLETPPKAVVLIDALYERMPLMELKVAEIPVVALVDSNTNPKGIDYPVPGNDDAIKSVKLFMRYFADAILRGNKGKGVEHELEDYSTIGVKSTERKSAESEEKMSATAKAKALKEKVKKEKKKSSTKAGKSGEKKSRAKSEVKRKTKKVKKAASKKKKSKSKRIKKTKKSSVTTKKVKRKKKKASKTKKSSKSKNTTKAKSKKK